jgi:hypothetical protein
MSPSRFLSLELASTMHHLALRLHYHLFNSSSYSALGSLTVAGNGLKDGSLFSRKLWRPLLLEWLPASARGGEHGGAVSSRETTGREERFRSLICYFR